jgi:Cu(I)/Ag(I) efflux system membrane fusion protein
MRYLDVPESAINELTRSGNSRLRIPVYAPQFGTVIRFNVRKNDYVSEGEPMLTIADLSSVWIEVDIFQDQLAWLRRNQKAEIIVDVLPGERLVGRVDYIGPELDPRTRTVKARLIVANPDFILRPNMYAQVTIFDDAQQDILIIPREALIETGDRSSVIKSLGDGLFMPVDVVAGFRSDGEVEIKSGLSEGDLVVTSGQFLIDSEANLRASFRRLGHSHETVPEQHAEY